VQLFRGTYKKTTRTLPVGIFKKLMAFCRIGDNWKITFAGINNNAVNAVGYRFI
jgi:hypothetical protein